MSTKAFSMLKAPIFEKYLSGRNGEQMTWLEIPNTLKREDLKRDIELGAVHLKDLYQYTENPTLHTTIVHSYDRESGLIAVAYLAALYNEADGIRPGFRFDDEDDEQERQFCEEPPEEKEFEYEQMCSIDEYLDESLSEYEEWPWRLPIIKASECFDREEYAFDIFSEQNHVMGGNEHTGGREPYWFACTGEPVCVDLGGCMSVGDAKMEAELQRFQKNRHVYLLDYDRDIDFDHFRSASGDGENAPVFEKYCALILAFCAGTVRIPRIEDHSEFRKKQMLGMIHEMDHALGRGIRADKIIKLFLDIDAGYYGKSEKMEKLLRYMIRHKKQKDGILNKKDFHLLEELLATKKRSDRVRSDAIREQDLIGLESVKDTVNGMVALQKLNRQRRKLGLNPGDFHNVCLMIGPPGTAKTTVAKMLGQRMQDEGLIGCGSFISVNGAQLKGMYVGHTAPMVHALFEENDIIFIDEAYSLAAGDGNVIDTFGQEAIAQLLVEIENSSNEKLVILAGYGGSDVQAKDNKMKQFLDANPGLRSRINTTLVFEPYSAEQMVRIVHQLAENKGYRIDTASDMDILDYFRSRVGKRDFGNGREARNLVDHAVMYAADRIMEQFGEDRDKEQMISVIAAGDIQAAIEDMKDSLLQQEGSTALKGGFLFS